MCNKTALGSLCQHGWQRRANPQRLTCAEAKADKLASTTSEMMTVERIMRAVIEQLREFESVLGALERFRVMWRERESMASNRLLLCPTGGSRVHL